MSCSSVLGFQGGHFTVRGVFTQGLNAILFINLPSFDIFSGDLSATKKKLFLL